MQDLKQEMNQMKLDLGIVKKVYCSKEEQDSFRRMEKEKIPNEILIDSGNGQYFRYIDEGMAKQEIDELFAYRQISYLRTIKKCAVFFVILTVISLLVWIYFLLNGRLLY